MDHQNWLREEQAGRKCFNCFNDVEYMARKRRVRESNHYPIAEQWSVEEALSELAFILQTLNGEGVEHIGAANHFPMCYLSLVAAVDDQNYEKMKYEYVPERNIVLCKYCVESIWGKIATFKEKWPELFMPEIKEPECE